MAQSPEQLRQALDELSLPEDDAENPLRLVRARVELLLEDNAGAAKDAGIFLNAATDATDPFYTATARAIRAIATENQGSVGEVVQDLMALETVTGDPKNKDAEVRG